MHPDAALAYWLVRDAGATARAPELDADALRALSTRRLRTLLAAAERAPFHAGRMRGPLARAHRLPDGELPLALLELAPVTKAELREAGAGAVAGGRVSPAWFSSRSSGSSGEPFRVYYDARAWSMLKYLVKLRARRAIGMSIADRLAILDAIAPEEEGRSLLERAGRVRRISVFRPATEIAAALAAYMPATIYALSSSLLEVARAFERGAPRASPRRIVTSGELLTRAARRTIESAFGATLSDVYGTSETKEIAWECTAGSRHVNADVVHVEILDDEGSPAPAGAEGEIVVTLLVNSAMPLVRYRTGDRGALLASRCSCGRESPLLGVLAGRDADVLELSDGSTCSPYLLTTALERVTALAQYQVVQTERDVLQVNAIAEDDRHPAALERTIRDALESVLSPLVRIDVSFVDRLSRAARAKVRTVQPLPRSRMLPAALAVMPGEAP